MRRCLIIGENLCKYVPGQTKNMYVCVHACWCVCTRVGVRKCVRVRPCVQLTFRDEDKSGVTKCLCTCLMGLRAYMHVLCMFLIQGMCISCVHVLCGRRGAHVGVGRRMSCMT